MFQLLKQGPKQDQGGEKKEKKKKRNRRRNGLLVCFADKDEKRKVSAMTGDYERKEKRGGTMEKLKERGERRWPNTPPGRYH